MSDYETVLIERRDGVALVTMNRPDALNSMAMPLRRDLLQAAQEVNADDSIRVVVLTGAGRGFGAGADLTEVADPSGQLDVRDYLNDEFKPILMAISNAPKPWISAVNGPAAGISASFAMACDLTVMAEDAYMYQAFTAISLVPDGGATWHLVRTLGRKRAYEVIATGEKVKAQKCMDWGLCNRVVAPEALVDETMAWAAELAAKAPLSLRYAKEALNGAIEEPLADTISAEAELQHICINSEDAGEGALAFLEKRPPQWKGC